MTDTRGDHRPEGDKEGPPRHEADTAGTPRKTDATGTPRHDMKGTPGGSEQHPRPPGTQPPSSRPPGPRPPDSGRPKPPDPRGPHPRGDRREQTRTALLAAAERLWAEHGIHGASLDDIAAAAGLTKGAVYSNFAGKTDLLLALMERFTTDRTIDVCGELRAAEEDIDHTGRSSPRHDPDDHPRRLALLLVEFWLYGMRDYAAGWRIADWYAERRAQMASELEPTEGIAPHDRATLTLALNFGLAFQHLLDPARVPADLYKTGQNLMLGHNP